MAYFRPGPDQVLNTERRTIVRTDDMLTTALVLLVACEICSLWCASTEEGTSLMSGSEKLQEGDSALAESGGTSKVLARQVGPGEAFQAGRVI